MVAKLIMEEKIKELLDKINIDVELEKDSDYFVGYLESYEDFVNTYNKLERSLDVFKNSLASFMTEEDSHIQYETDDGFIIEVVAIFDSDNYSINISKDKDD